MYCRNRARYFIFPAMIAVVALAIAACASRHPIADRVPSHAMEDALSYKAPFGDTRMAPLEIVTAGKALYEGKGNCILCHGISGKGDGPAAHMHDPHLPTDFTNCSVQNMRKDGELFWVIKHGSPGTGMKSLIPGMLSEEEGWKLVAYVRTFCTAHS